MNRKHVPREKLVSPPCREACPAGVDVPRYIRNIKEGKFDEALAVIHEAIPLASICGYACYAPCESRCGNRQFGDPIAIRALKRTAAERGGELWRKNLTIAPATGKSVAIVGSGPSGLTAAYYLATMGHKVTVFEALDQAGGMMRVGIPEYRLPREALDKEIGYIEEMGVEIRTGHRVESVNQLIQDGFNAVYLACGAHKGAELRIPGDDLPGVLDGIVFLRKINENEKVVIGTRVAIIGGGNTAVDAARCAIRLGAKDVNVIYRRSQAEMTAYEEEVGAAIMEGIRIEFLATPVQIAQKGGALDVTLARMKLGKPDDSGRPRPEPVEGGEFSRGFDTVITAVGQVPDIPETMGIALSEGNLVKVDNESMATDRSGVFAGGDLVSGPASIIEAISHGRKAASSIDVFLGGKGMTEQELAPPENEVVVMDYQTEDQIRVAIPCIPIEERTGSFQVVDMSLTEDSAKGEAERCRCCDARFFEVDVHGEGCKECGYCSEVCGLEVFESSEQFNVKGYRPMIARHKERCVGCMLCFFACPDFSIEVAEKA